MANFNRHCHNCEGYFEFSDYDFQNKPLATIKKFKNRNNKYNFNSYDGIAKHKGGK